MNVSCSMKGFVDITRPRRGLGEMAKAGFTNLFLDLSTFVSGYDLENLGKPGWKKNGWNYLVESPEELKNVLSNMQSIWSSLQLKSNVAMAPFLLRETKRDDLFDLQKKLTEESILACGEVGSRYLIVRPLTVGVVKNDLWKINQMYYLQLAKLAKENNLILLLENQCEYLHGHLIKGVCANGVDAAEWVDRLNEINGEERFGFCYNVGTANLCGQDMYHFIQTMDSRIKAVILSDGNGNQENAMLPFTAVNQGRSQTDWLNLIRGLRKIEFDGELILNTSDTANALSGVLRPAFLQFTKAVADYFKWQIEIEKMLKKYPARVLFGAGNMCRNYMKSYGKDYPPLFTCDNNPAVWGTFIDGLEVKDPKELKNLPKDCAVFICNIYYDEIQKQLQEIGIKNPIEFFNDEYMPGISFTY